MSIFKVILSLDCLSLKVNFFFKILTFDPSSQKFQQFQEGPIFDVVKHILLQNIYASTILAFVCQEKLTLTLLQGCLN